MTKHISCIYLNRTDYQLKKTGNFSNYSVQATINLSLTLYRYFQVHVFLKTGVLLRTILYYCKSCNFHGFSQLILEHSTFKKCSKCVTVTSSLLVRMFPTLHMENLGDVFQRWYCVQIWTHLPGFVAKYWEIPQLCDFHE